MCTGELTERGEHVRPTKAETGSRTIPNRPASNVTAELLEDWTLLQQLSVPVLHWSTGAGGAGPVGVATARRAREETMASLENIVCWVFE